MYLNELFTPVTKIRNRLTVTLDVFKWTICHICNCPILWLTVTLDVFKLALCASFSLELLRLTVTLDVFKLTKLFHINSPY